MNPEGMNPNQEAQMIAPVFGIGPRMSTSTVSIRRCENGYIVEGGCKTFCFPSFDLAAEAIGLYFKNPLEAEKKYCRQ